MKSFLFRPFACALAALFLLLPAAVGCSDDGSEELPPILEADGEADGTTEYDRAEEATDNETQEERETTGSGEEPAEPPSAADPEEDPSAPEEEPDEPEEEPDEPASAQYILIKTSGLNIRAGAGTGYTVLAQAEKDTLLACGRQLGSWFQTYYRNRVAYVSAKTEYTELVTIRTGSEKTESVIAEGIKLLGTPYVYGAVRLHDGKGNLLKSFTVTKFDCSSLTQYIFYYGSGTLLDTTTRTQVLQGTAVAKSALQRGDLMFFTNSSRYYNTGIERIGHVALYLGDNYILHTASDYAKIEQISVQRWSYYITARRITE